MVKSSIAVISFLAVLSACSQPGKGLLKPFNLADVDSVVMQRILWANDTTHDPGRKLGPAQTETLVNKINAAESWELWKFRSEYGLTIYLKDHSTRSITTNQAHFKLKAEQGDRTFSVNDTGFFNGLYYNKQHF